MKPFSKIPISIILTISLILVYCLSFSQPQKGLFWEVVKNGSTDTSYLLGTIHRYPKEVIQLPNQVFCRLKKSKKLFLEVHMNFSMAIQALSSGNFNNSEDPEKPEWWNEEAEDALKKWFVETKMMDEKDYDKVKLQMTGFNLSKMVLKSYGFEEGSIERDLQVLSHANNIALKGLDKNWAEYQNWYAWYNSNLDDLPKNFDNLESMLNFYDQNLADLFIGYAIQDTVSLTKDPKSKDNWEKGLSLVEWRNIRWMKDLKNIMMERNFVAVGAAHLFGPNGLISLLSSEGFICTPIASDFTGPKLERFINRYGTKYEVVER